MDVSTRVADRYRIDARIGGGGMADVFEARDEALDRDVAIKLLRGIDDPAAARRFAEEIRLTARLNHANVVQLFDAGEHDGSPFLVLERVTGGTLAQAMAGGGMDPQRVADIGRQTAAALEHAHGQRIVHRDVKPSNILLTSDGTVRLADFGIALTATATRLTVAGSVAGSAGYVSPEQVLGTGAGAASDVYALGLVLLECLTGEPPWSGTTVEVALARITADPPLPDAVPEAWRGLLAAMTAREPAHRPPMDVVATALTELASGRPTIPFVLPATPAPPRRQRASVLVGSALLLLAAAVMVLNAMAGGDAAPGAVPTTVEPGGVIAASVVRGAAVGEAAAAEAAPPAPEQNATRPAKRAGPETKMRDGEDAAATADAPTGAAGAGSAGNAPRAGAAPSAAKPAGATQERTRTTPRDTADQPREQPREPTGSDGTADSDATSGEDDATEGSGEDSTEDVADTTKQNNGKGAAKRRSPDVSNSAGGLGVGGPLK